MTDDDYIKPSKWNKSETLYDRSLLDSLIVATDIARELRDALWVLLAVRPIGNRNHQNSQANSALIRYDKVMGQ